MILSKRAGWAMNFSICVEMIYSGLPFPERIDRLRLAGFTAFEFWAWKDKDLAAIESRVEKGMQLATFSGQRRGSLVEPADHPAYLEEVQESIQVARRLGCGHLMVLSDQLSADGSVTTRYRPMDPDEKIANIALGLRQLVPLAEEHRVTLILEPLNTRVDHPGYTLDSSRAAFDIVTRVGSERVKVLYDIYHMQIMEGNVIQTLRDNLRQIGYIHAADVPGRHEPGTGELNYENILKAIADMGYQGYVGFEFQPEKDSESALATIRECVSPWAT
jgi:hydroxypyruvate isomerase